MGRGACPGSQRVCAAGRQAGAATAALIKDVVHAPRQTAAAAVDKRKFVLQGYQPVPSHAAPGT